MRWIVVAVLLLVVSDVQAQGRRWRRQQWQPVYQQVQAAPVQQATGQEVPDALDEVNKYRASKGLKPFIKDELLTKGAFACAKERAKRQIHGHLSSDFDYLPAGANATAAGCAAWRDGFGACCMDDDYTFAGAAYVVGSDGLRYCHLFVR